MPPLLFLTATLLAVSGALELRSLTRSGLGIPLLPVVELVAALCLAAFATSGLASPGPARWLVPGGVLLVLVSSVRTTLRLREQRRLRELSTASRLATYVKHMTGSDGEAH